MGGSFRGTFRGAATQLSSVQGVTNTNTGPLEREYGRASLEYEKKSTATLSSDPGPLSK
jgi:hypothetical protein